MRRYGKSRTLPAPPQQTLAPSLMTNTIDNKRVLTRGLYLRDESGLCPGGDTVPRFGPDGQMLFSTVTIDACGGMIVPAGLVVGDNADICGDLMVGGNGHIGGNLDVSGNTYIHANLFVDGSGAIGGDLEVSGNTHIYENLTVDGSGGIGGDLDVSGSVRIHENLTVDGVIYAVDISVNGVMSISGDLTVDRIHVREYIDDAMHVSSVNTDIVRAIEVFVGSESLNPAVNVTPGYNLDVSGSTLVRNNLAVRGRTDISGSVQIDGRLDVSGGTRVGGNFDVSGDSVFHGDVRFEGDVDISGPMVFKSTVTVWGNTDLCSNLTVTGTTTICGNTDLCSNLTVVGTIDSIGDIDVTRDTVPAIAVNTPGPTFRRGGMFWNTAPGKDCFTIDTSYNMFPIELQGSVVNVTSSVAANGYVNVYPTSSGLTGTPNIQLMGDASGTLPFVSIYDDEPYANRATNPVTSQLQIRGKTTSNRLYVGTYYTSGSGTCGSIQASDFYSGADHGVSLLLNPLGGYVGINTSSPVAPLDVSGAARIVGQLTLDTGVPIVPNYVYYKYRRVAASTNLGFSPPQDIVWDTIDVDSNIYSGRLTSNKDWVAPVDGIYSVVVGINAHLANAGTKAVEAKVELRLTSIGPPTFCTPSILVNSFKTAAGDYMPNITTTQTYTLLLKTADELRVIYTAISSSTDFFIDPDSTLTIMLLQRTA